LPQHKEFPRNLRETSELLTVKGLKYVYPTGNVALDGLNLEIKRGERLFVLGENGAGKTTFFLHLNGILKPTAGELFWRGEKFSYKKDFLLRLRQKVGVVFQDPETQLFAGTVAEEISYGLFNLGYSESKVREKVEETLKELGIWELRDRPIASLSLGQKKLVALGAILAMEPELLVLDEPTAFLDRYHTRLFLNIVERQWQKGITIVAATHEIDLAYRFADRVAVLHAGKLLASGPPEEILLESRILESANLEEPWLLKGSKILKESGRLLAHEYPVKEEKKFWEVLGRVKTSRYGVATGTVAAAAALGAARFLLFGEKVEAININTPAGITFTLTPEILEKNEAEAVCGIRKEAGDDPDVTDQALIMARVRRQNFPGITIKGGRGVGVVTEPGLAVPVGEAAINPVPRQQIKEALEPLILGGETGLEVIIEVPEGEKLASKTLNPILGIKGGISILGTRGIVVPYSREAYIESLQLQLKRALYLDLKRLVFVLGNKSKKVAQRLNVPAEAIVETGNYLGDMLKISENEGVEKILIIGYLGKLIKTYLGILNLHSQVARGQKEALALFLYSQGESQELINKIYSTKNVEQALEILRKEGKEHYLSLLARAVKEKLKSYYSGLTMDVAFTDISGAIIATTFDRLEEGWPWDG